MMIEGRDRIQVKDYRYAWQLERKKTSRTRICSFHDLEILRRALSDIKFSVVDTLEDRSQFVHEPCEIFGVDALTRFLSLKFSSNPQDVLLC